MSGRTRQKVTIYRWRYLVVLAALLLLPLAAVWHIAGLQVLPNKDRGYEFLQKQNRVRTVRVETIPAYRGVITDRHGEPLAVSTPVISLWANPQVLVEYPGELGRLARALGVGKTQLQQKLTRYRGKEFMYLARHLPPAKAEKMLALEIPGVYSRVEFRRYYPAGEVTAHLVGFTDIDHRGQEGMELAYEKHLQGKPGAKKVLKDLKGRVIKDLALVRGEKAGANLVLSINLRLQYAAYRELKAMVAKQRAKSGSVVVLDVQTGEVLAMVNQPSYNPNDRGQLKSEALRNRALTDLVEPGSLMKPLMVAAALETGQFHPTTRIDTNPGYYSVGRKTFVDHRNYGVLDVTGILAKSSQVGTTKLALQLDPDHVWDMFYRMGLGQSADTGFPGENPGSLPRYSKWKPIERANFAFGHGLSATAMQLASAYAVLANDGLKRPATLLKKDGEDQVDAVEQVLSPAIARQVRTMLQAVIQEGGTATRAAIPAYNVAGKTGTVHKVGKHGYEKNRYVSLFAGMVPVDNPRIVTVVIVDDPSMVDYFGGMVAAPVFANVADQALRLLSVPPDSQPGQQSLAGGKTLMQGET